MGYFVSTSSDIRGGGSDNLASKPHERQNQPRDISSKSEIVNNETSDKKPFDGPSYMRTDGDCLQEKVGFLLSTCFSVLCFFRFENVYS